MKQQSKSSSKKSLRITDNFLREILIKRLPKLLKKEPPLKKYLIEILKEDFADKKETEKSIRELIEELKALRLESEKKFEEHTKILKEQNKRLEEQNKRLEEQNKRLEEHSKRLEEHSKLLEEHSKRLEEHSKLLEEHSKRLEEHSKRLEEQSKRLEEHSKRLEEHSKHLEELYREVKALHRRYDTGIGALGARWGIRAESSFREAIKAILKESFSIKVERYLDFDSDGLVFGHPDQIELDLILKNGFTIVAEIKSSVSREDVAILKRKIDFFEKKTHRKVDRILIISPMTESKAIELAKKFGFEVYSYPEEVEEL